MRLVLFLCACSSNPAPDCRPPDGGNCACSPTDTFRNCNDKSGAAGLEFCANGMWSECAPFLDAGTD